MTGRSTAQTDHYLVDPPFDDGNGRDGAISYRVLRSKF